MPFRTCGFINPSTANMNDLSHLRWRNGLSKISGRNFDAQAYDAGTWGHQFFATNVKTEFA